MVMPCATDKWGKIRARKGAGGTHAYPWRTGAQCATAKWGKIGATNVHPVPHLAVAHIIVLRHA